MSDFDKPVHRQYHWRLQVRTEAHLDSWLADVLVPLDLTHCEDGTSLLSGTLGDISAVYGSLLKLRDTGVHVISLLVEREQDA